LLQKNEKFLGNIGVIIFSFISGGRFGASRKLWYQSKTEQKVSKIGHFCCLKIGVTILYSDF